MKQIVVYVPSGSQEEKGGFNQKKNFSQNFLNLNGKESCKNLHWYY